MVSWFQDGFGLGMDVAMKESYGGGVGFVPYEPEGNLHKSQLRNFPMTHEPLWSMPDPVAKGSPTVLRSAVYSHTMASQYDNNFYVTNPTGYGSWAMDVASMIASNEMAMLTPAFRNLERLGRAYVQPMVRDISPGVIDPANPTRPPTTKVAGRVWTEPVPSGVNESAASSYYCYHVVTGHGSNFPLMTTLSLDNVTLPTSAILPAPHLNLNLNAADVHAHAHAQGGAVDVANPVGVVLIQRLFRGTNPYPINGTVWANGSITFSDMFDLQTANIYRLGCDVPMPSNEGELCAMESGTNNAKGRNGKGMTSCDFENCAGGESGSTTTTTTTTSTVPGSEAGQTGLLNDNEQLVQLNMSDDRTWGRCDSSAPYNGRYAARINVPTAFPVNFGLASAVDTYNATGSFKVRWAARSSPAGMKLGAVWQQSLHGEIAGASQVSKRPDKIETLTTEWQVFEAIVQTETYLSKGHWAAVQLWMQSDFSTGGIVWIDAVSIINATSMQYV
jgi:hypothetical protein